MVINLLPLVFVGVVMVSNEQYPVGQCPDGFFVLSLTRIDHSFLYSHILIVSNIVYAKSS